MARLFAHHRFSAAALIALVSALGMTVAVPVSSQTPAPAAKAKAPVNFSGIWEPLPGGKKELAPPAYTARALKALKPTLTPGEAEWAEHGIEHSDANCLPRRQPWMLLQSAPISILHDGDKMILLYEKRSSPMHVYLDGREHPDMATWKPNVNGHAIGRWEGRDLIVDSVGFADVPGHGPVATLPFLSTTRITQRFSLSPNGRVLKARFTIEDPEQLEKPYVYDFSWRKLPYATNFALAETCDARDPARLRY